MIGCTCAECGWRNRAERAEKDSEWFKEALQRIASLQCNYGPSDYANQWLAVTRRKIAEFALTPSKENP